MHAGLAEVARAIMRFSS